MASPNLFVSTSSEAPEELTVSFASQPTASLGAQLENLDKRDDNVVLFTPSYASVGRLLDGRTIARKSGVAIGDYIVAVNGEGFRRHAPDFNQEEVKDVTILLDEMCMDDFLLARAGSHDADVVGQMDAEAMKKLKNRVIKTGIRGGEAYKALLAKIMEMKKGHQTPIEAPMIEMKKEQKEGTEEEDIEDNNNAPQEQQKQALILHLERYKWDSRVNSWGRFLASKEDNVPDALKMLQEHELWKSKAFPLNLDRTGLQQILKSRAVAEINAPRDSFSPVIYIDYYKLQAFESLSSPEDVVDAFIMFTERLLAKAKDPRNPKLTLFIDLTDVKITKVFNTDVLKLVYSTFAPNYPETLDKMMIFPVTKNQHKAATTLLNFVDEKTSKKFIMTEDLDVVCDELGWDRPDVSRAGGVAKFVAECQEGNGEPNSPTKSRLGAIL